MIHRETVTASPCCASSTGKANTLDMELCNAVVEAFEHAGDARAVVLTGAGRIFSAGVDLFRVLEGGERYIEAFVPAMCRAFERVFVHPAPVVAAANGHDDRRRLPARRGGGPATDGGRRREDRAPRAPGRRAVPAPRARDHAVRNPAAALSDHRLPRRHPRAGGPRSHSDCSTRSWSPTPCSTVLWPGPSVLPRYPRTPSRSRSARSGVPPWSGSDRWRRPPRGRCRRSGWSHGLWTASAPISTGRSRKAA